MTGSYNDFFQALGQRESNGRHNFTSELGYLGKYQLGELALVDIGYYKGDGSATNDWNGKWTGKGGVRSKQDFLNNPAVQEQAMQEYITQNWIYAKTVKGASVHSKAMGYRIYNGQVLNGQKITISGMLAGMHLLGISGLAEYIKNGGITRSTDPNGVTLSDYLTEFGSFDTPYMVNHEGSDTLIGGNGPDQLFGWGGQDLLTGKGQSDQLQGGQGNDQLDGEAGDDLLFGFDPNQAASSVEVDILTGGSGSDTFTLGTAAGSYYNQGNRRIALGKRAAHVTGAEDYALIKDFNVGQDWIQLAANSGQQYGTINLTAAQTRSRFPRLGRVPTTVLSLESAGGDSNVVAVMQGQNNLQDLSSRFVLV
jgi:Ca2+-binding RTX toxin-like protein